MNVIFVGSDLKGYYVEEVCEAEGLSMGYISTAMDKVSLTKAVIRSAPSIAVINLEELSFSGDDIGEIFENVRNAIGCQIIFMGSGYTENMSIIRQMKELGFNEYILSVNLSEMKNELRQCLNRKTGFDDRGDDNFADTDYEGGPSETSDAYGGDGSKTGKEGSETANIGRKTANAGQKTGKYDLGTDKTGCETAGIKATEKKIRRSPVKIGVCGCMNRIGTTTVCIQIVKHLNLTGKKACYIQMDNSGHMELYRDYLSGRVLKKSADPGHFRYSYVEVFCSWEAFLNAENEPEEYDYIVCDYGVESYEKDRFQNILNSDISVVVGGIEPNEIEALQDVLGFMFDYEAQYVFSFVAENDRECLSEMMGEKADDTSYIENTPDAFSYNIDNDIWIEKIIYRHSVKAERESEKRKKIPILPSTGEKENE